MSKMIIESRCRLCGAMVTETVEPPFQMKADYRQNYCESVMGRKLNRTILHPCGRGRTGVLEVIGMFPADEPEERK